MSQAGDPDELFEVTGNELRPVVSDNAGFNTGISFQGSGRVLTLILVRGWLARSAWCRRAIQLGGNRQLDISESVMRSIWKGLIGNFMVERSIWLQ